ncbi:cell wall metabolism sensor histidine kinase WalK [Tsukamurella sp. PLM1]|uniref:sensor histidine kinase n=1 Tax=Tsukamurella sp. PLM1 TaxID=2929795 RepID=UPI00206D6AFB|nr:ATP-binding protein [Tsukamurella sp. PLM1]BDH55606.1 sensor-like histidine kinase senX3 [Tsukamurella sp. PLM1]
MTVALCVVSALAGALIGWLARRVRQRVAAPVDTGPTRMTVAELNRAVVQESPTGLVVVDRFRDVILCNARAEAFSLVREQLLDDRVWNAVSQVLATGAPRTVELTVTRRADRAAIAVRCRVDLIEGTAPDERYAVVYADDDTENQRMEATRRDFVANVSHELKTPVGAIGLLSEALLESVDDPEAVQHFGSRVLVESTRMGNMVNELIALSRLQGAEKLPDLGRVEVDDIVGEAVARAQVSAEANNISLIVDQPSGLEIRGDDTLLLTALSNLISNAIAYSPQNTQVSISRRARPGGGPDGTPSVEIAVTDRGIGIAPEDQERVFERFFRVDKARSRMTGGTGLGLAIVKHVAANHGGAIRLWSKPGMGSTFTLVLPALTAPVSGANEHDDHSEDVLR